MLYLHVKVKKGFAEKAKKYLLNKDVIDRTKSTFHKGEYVYFPVKHEVDVRQFQAELIKIAAIEYRKKSYSELTKKLFDKQVNTGYDTLGNIAIIDEMNDKDAKELANIIIASNKSITTVLKKAGAVTGEYRTRQYKFVSGKRTFTAKYKENGCSFIFDVRKTFFSSRLSFERARIVQTIKPGENVIVMFAGVGPFAIEIAKKDKNAKIIAIELNPYAYKYMKKNIKINKTTNVKPIFGDVKKEYKNFKAFADHVIMPLPKISTNFLKEALYTLKDEGIIHIYLFVERQKGIVSAEKWLKDKVKEYGYKAKIVFSRKVRDYSPTEIEIVVEMKAKPIHYI